MAELIDLVPKEFKDNLTDAEKGIIEKAPTGEIADMLSGDEKVDNPANAENWPESRTVRSKFLEWLLRDKKARVFIHDKGIIIFGIRIDGGLDLYSLTFPFPLIIHYSHFADGVNLGFARVKLIDFSNSHFNGFKADGLVIEHSAFFNNSRSEGEFRLVAANIGGNLDCDGTKFINGNGKAFDGGTMITKGTVFLNGIKSLGEFNVVGANIGGGFECNGAKFMNKNGQAFVGDQIAMKGTVFLNGIRAWGGFRLLGANIAGNLECTGAKFMNRNGDSFIGDRIVAKGDVFLDQIESKGVFRLVGVNIDGNLSCTGANFINEKGEAFNGDGKTTKGIVFLRRIECKGEFRLVNAHIGIDLYCDGASFQNKEKPALRITQAQIDGRLCLDKVKKVQGKIALSNAKAGAFVDDENSWPDGGNLILDGFEYGSFAETTPTDVKTRLKWVKLQPQGEYIPQPYQQLAKVYRKMGRDRDARKVLLAKERMRQKYGDIGKLAKIWGWFLDITIGYGYQIGKALGIVAGIIALGVLIFGLSNWCNIIQLTSEGTTEKALLEFSPLFYSIDVFVPFLDLRQENYWMVNSNVKWGWWVQFYCYLHIISGWVFSTLLVAGFTGLIRRE